MSKILEIKDLKTYYTVRKSLFRTLDVKAVDGVTLTISQGETVAIVGESGSGKTTLGRTVLKLVKSSGGTISFQGSDITKDPRDEKEFRKKAQIIFQDPFMSLNPYMTIKQVIEEPLIVHNEGTEEERREKIIKALNDVRLFPPEEFLLKYPHMLSGGQRQRVGIARALVLDPIFLVADEPVSMIDASSRAEILSLLKELQKTYNMGVMYITHDIATAKYFSDLIAVMYLGKIVEYGETKEVINNSLHPYTKALIAAVPDPDPKNRFRKRPVIPGEPPSPINPPSGCNFHPRCPSRFDPCDRDEPPLKEGKSKANISARARLIYTKIHQVACYLY
jgi:peptide/nickel transport system ATP-binding protein